VQQVYHARRRPATAPVTAVAAVRPCTRLAGCVRSRDGAVPDPDILAGWSEALPAGLAFAILCVCDPSIVSR